MPGRIRRRAGPLPATPRRPARGGVAGDDGLGRRLTHAQPVIFDPSTGCSGPSESGGRSVPVVHARPCRKVGGALARSPRAGRSPASAGLDIGSGRRKAIFALPRREGRASAPRAQSALGHGRWPGVAGRPCGPKGAMVAASPDSRSPGSEAAHRDRSARRRRDAAPNAPGKAVTATGGRRGEAGIKRPGPGTPRRGPPRHAAKRRGQPASAESSHAGPKAATGREGEPVALPLAGSGMEAGLRHRLNRACGANGHRPGAAAAWGAAQTPDRATRRAPLSSPRGIAPFPPAHGHLGRRVRGQREAGTVLARTLMRLDGKRGPGFIWTRKAKKTCEASSRP